MTWDRITTNFKFSPFFKKEKEEILWNLLPCLKQ